MPPPLPKPKATLAHGITVFPSTTIGSPYTVATPPRPCSRSIKD